MDSGCTVRLQRLVVVGAVGWERGGGPMGSRGSALRRAAPSAWMHCFPNLFKSRHTIMPKEKTYWVLWASFTQARSTGHSVAGFRQTASQTRRLCMPHGC